MSQVVFLRETGAAAALQYLLYISPASPTPTYSTL